MQKIHVKNFKAIKDMEIELNNALLLIGEPATGKSTIGKLIYFFKSLRQDFVDMVFGYLENDQVPLETTFRKKAFEKFYNYFGSTRHLHQAFQAQYNYAPDRNITLSLHPDKSLKIFIGPEGHQDFYQDLFYNNRLLTVTRRVKQYSDPQNAYERREFQLANSRLETYVNQLFNDSRIPLFIPAGRNITVNYPEQFKLYSNLQSDLLQQQTQEAQSVDLHLMLRFLEQAERMKQRFQSYDFETLIADKLKLGGSINKKIFDLVQDRINKILKGKYSHDQYGEKLYFADDRFKDEQYVHFRNASSGQQEAIRILQDIFLILLDGNDVFRVIEEPEAHLYPMAQKYLIELIAIILNESDSQIIMTTHSPYILSVMNNLLFATRVVRKNDQAVQEVTEIIPKPCWLDPDTTNVYFLKNGYAESVFDESTSLIGQNYLDEISEHLGADFEGLYAIHARAFA